MRFETVAGERAQADCDSFSYVVESCRDRWVWAFVMVGNWSCAIRVEFVRRTDASTFIRCHVNALACLGSAPVVPSRQRKSWW
jgi:transposase